MRDGRKRMAAVLAMFAVLAMTFGLTAGVPQEAVADGTGPADTIVVPSGGGGMPALPGSQTAARAGDSDIGDGSIAVDNTLETSTIVKIMFAFAFVIR